MYLSNGNNPFAIIIFIMSIISSTPIHASLICFIIVVLGIPVTIYFLKKFSIYDIPNNRSSHVTPIPRAGGIPLIIAIIGVSFIYLGSYLQLIILVIPYAILGLIDDFRNVSAKVRLFIQFVLAILDAILLLPPRYLIWILPATLFVIGFVNAWNFMDGINGLSAFSCILIGGTWWVLGVMDNYKFDTIVGSIAVGIGIGFAIYNAFVPKVFLGDVGAYGLGAMFGGSVIFSFKEPKIVIPMLLPLLPAIVDTGFTIIKRAIKKESLLKSHRDHTYQNLIDKGFSHFSVAIIYSFFILCCSMMAILVTQSNKPEVFVEIMACLLINGLYLMSPKILTSPEKTIQNNS
jgi:UDP-N-acetylmuramyl pentapeptide phosphotransferase/UDP-N-acetylglucosamine-1-phosphate transferase